MRPIRNESDYITLIVMIILFSHWSVRNLLDCQVTHKVLYMYIQTFQPTTHLIHFIGLGHPTFNSYIYSAIYLFMCACVLYPGLPVFSTYARKIGKAWSIWWCNWMWFEAWLGISAHLPTQLVTWRLMTTLIVWVSGRRYISTAKTAPDYITKSTRPSRFFLLTFKNMGMRLCPDREI